MAANTAPIQLWEEAKAVINRFMTLAAILVFGIVVIISTFGDGSAYARSAKDEDPVHKSKEIGKDVADKTKKTGKAVGEKTVEGTGMVIDKTTNAATAVGSKTKDGAGKVVDVTKEGAKKTFKVVKKIIPH
jgi:hypothetical protein